MTPQPIVPRPMPRPDVVEAFSSECDGPRLRERLGIRCHCGCSSNLNPIRIQQRIKRPRGFVMSVIDQRCRLKPVVFDSHQQVPG